VVVPYIMPLNAWGSYFSFVFTFFLLSKHGSRWLNLRQGGNCNLDMVPAMHPHTTLIYTRINRMIVEASKLLLPARPRFGWSQIFLSCAYRRATRVHPGSSLHPCSKLATASSSSSTVAASGANPHTTTSWVAVPARSCHSPQLKR
jgi:hypothetical protein